jgi:hypothetical protein
MTNDKNFKNSFLLTITIASVCVLCVSCSYLITRPARNNEMVSLSYNDQDHTLLIINGESGKYMPKITMDLHRDTLLVNAYKKFVMFGRCGIVSNATWKIKLMPNVGFVKLGDVLTPLSEFRKYTKEDLIERYYPRIEVFPKKFPYVGK